MTSRRRPLARFVGLALTGLAFLPVALSSWRAHAEDADAAPPDGRARVLARVATDETALINVTAREMPASPDLLNLGRKSTRALERCLADNVDAPIRATCAHVLAALGDPASLPTLRAALDDWDAGVRGAVLHALARIPHPDSYPAVAKVLSRADEEEYNRAAALTTLGALGSTKAVQALRTELAKSDSPLRATAFHALWHSRHLMARSTLEQDLAAALASKDAALVLAATVAAAELRSPRLSAPLTALVEDANPEIRNKAVYALGKIGDRAAVRTLRERIPKVREARMLNNIAFALERLDPKTFFPAVGALISHKQAVIRMNAAFVLGDVRRGEGRPMLEQALADPSDFVKASALAALGKLGTPEAGPALEKFADHPNPNLRAEAIYALYALAREQRAGLVYDRLYSSPNPGVRHRAALALAKVRDPRVRDYLLACYETHQCGLAEVGDYFEHDSEPHVAERLLLEFARGRGEARKLVARLRPPGSVPIALSYYASSLARRDIWSAQDGVDLLGALGDKAALPRLVPERAAPNTSLRFHANVALARLGDPAADATLLTDLDTCAHESLPALSLVLSEVAEPDAQKRLAPELVKRSTGADVDVALAAAATLLAWDADAHVFRFIDALAAPSVRERDLADLYLTRDRRERVTWLLRRALARESRPATRDRLRALLDDRT